MKCIDLMTVGKSIILVTYTLDMSKRPPKVGSCLTIISAYDSKRKFTD